MAGKFSIVRFGGGNQDAKETEVTKETFGGKGANLIEMSANGFPVPPGFVIPCAASVEYKDLVGMPASCAKFMGAIFDDVAGGMKYLQGNFGYMPLVSVRSGARVSMPGMMDTILNVGLTTESLPFWKDKLGDRAALDSYRRLIQMYSSVALGVEMKHFDTVLEAVKHENNVKTDAELTAEHLEVVIRRYNKVLEVHDVEFPDTLAEQVQGAVVAVFQSWDNPRAKEYRKIHGYPDDWGTAVTVQSMVFGNLNDNSATGVVFTRCPSTGAPKMTGEYLINAQGEDVVAGIRTPEPVIQMAEWNAAVFDELVVTLQNLEVHYRDMQDVEFTVQDGKLYILQTRSGKRSAKAAFKIASDMAHDNMITPKEAVGRVTTKQLLAVMQATIDPEFKIKPHLTGIAAGGGLVTGVAVFTAEDAVNCKQPCILVRKETDPDDIAGMNASVGILTATGGLTSHAAVVARGMNKTCVVGCTSLSVGSMGASINGGPGIPAGTKLTIDGATGNVWVGIEVPVIPGGKSQEVINILQWAADAGGWSERVTLSHDMLGGDMQKTLAAVQSKSVYLDTALLESTTEAKTITAMKAIGILIADMDVEEIILDMRTLGEYETDDDRLLRVMLGKAPFYDLVGAKVEALATWPESVREKVMVRSASGYSTEIIGLGCRVCGKVATVADMLSASGPVEADPQVIKSVFGGLDAFDELRAMIEAHTGKSLSGKGGTPMYWYELLNKAA